LNQKLTTGCQAEGEEEEGDVGVVGVVGVGVGVVDDEDEKTLET